MDDFYDVFTPENNDYLMSDPEEDEPAPELSEPEPEPPEEVTGEPESADPAPEPEAPAEKPGEAKTPPGEETGGSIAGPDRVQDLIDAIGDLNETITGAVTEEPEEQPEEPPAGEESGGAAGGGGLDGASPGVDLTSVTELLGEVNDNLVTQHNDLLQVQANLDFVFLAVAALIGVVLGVVVGNLLHDLWRV